MGNKSNQQNMSSEGETTTFDNAPYSDEELNEEFSGDYDVNELSHYILGKLSQKTEEFKSYSDEELKDIIIDNEMNEMIDEAYHSPEAQAEFGPEFERSGYIDEATDSYVEDSIEALIDNGFLIEANNGLMLNPKAYSTEFPQEEYVERARETIYSFGVK